MQARSMIEGEPEWEKWVYRIRNNLTEGVYKQWSLVHGTVEMMRTLKSPMRMRLERIELRMPDRIEEREEISEGDDGGQ